MIVAEYISCVRFFLQMKMAGSNLLFAAITEISDNVLKGAETSGFNGMVLCTLGIIT